MGSSPEATDSSLAPLALPNCEAPKSIVRFSSDSLMSIGSYEAMAVMAPASKIKSLLMRSARPVVMTT
jgi:hypothetical protein